jgi:hypothetical protein
MTKNRRGIIQQVSKRFETTIIGALARFEDTFGYLWGHNSQKELTQKQQEFLDIWEVARTSILNHGNNQMRSAIDDIINYVEEENEYYKYRITLMNQNSNKK